MEPSPPSAGDGQPPAKAGFLAAPIRTLRAVDARIASVELVVALASLAGILVFTTIPIVLRAVGARAGAFWWTTPTSLYLLLTSTFLGASLAMRMRRHIQLDVVTRALPRRAKAAFGVVGWLIAAAVLGILCRAAVNYVEINWHQVSKLRGVVFGEWRLADLPLGPLLLPMPIALGMMAFRCLLSSLEDLRGAVTGDTKYMDQYEHVEGSDLHPIAPPPVPPPNGEPPPAPPRPEAIP